MKVSGFVPLQSGTRSTKFSTVEPRFNELLYNDVLGFTTGPYFLASNSKMYGKEPRFNEPSI